MRNELQLLIESIPAHVVVTTPSGEFETVNQPALEYFGKTLEELKDWTTSDVVHLVKMAGKLRLALPKA